jgi:hypothetical protein
LWFSAVSFEKKISHLGINWFNSSLRKPDERKQAQRDTSNAVLQKDKRARYDNNLPRHPTIPDICSKLRMMERNTQILKEEISKITAKKPV